MRGFPRRHQRRVIRISALAAGLVAVPLFGLSASAASGALTPILDCVSSDPVTGYVTAYYGYANTTGNGLTIPVGQNNQVFPAAPFQGQPDYFNVGDYPRVFSVTFDPALYQSIAWILNGQEADAYQGSQACASGVTTPADTVGATTATLTGVVLPEGVDTTYRFEWGVTASLGQTTLLTDAGSGGTPLLVQAPLTGLAPNTEYYYRLDVTNSFGSAQGDIRSFTTTLVPPLALTTVALPAAAAGTPYSASLTANGGIRPYTWSITKGTLPPGLSLNAATGVISGIPTSKGSAHITVAVTDPSAPNPVTVTGRFEIRIAKAP